MAIGTALATQALTTGAGIALNELVNPDAEIPDLAAETRAEFARRRQDLNETLDRRMEDVEAARAAEGQTGSAGTAERRELYSESADAQADLAARMADAIARAEQREEKLRFQQERGEEQARAQGISNVFGRGGQMLAMEEAQNGTVSEFLSNRFGMDVGGGSESLPGETVPGLGTGGPIAVSSGRNPFS